MNAICQNFFHLPQLSKYGNFLNVGTQFDIWRRKLKATLSFKSRNIVWVWSTHLCTGNIMSFDVNQQWHLGRWKVHWCLRELFRAADSISLRIYPQHPHWILLDGLDIVMIRDGWEILVIFENTWILSPCLNNFRRSW